jgi:hypothetical protein
MNAVEWLEQNGVQRDQIDAGYALNGGDLYLGAGGTESSNSDRVPMITSKGLAPYVISERPIAGLVIVRTFKVSRLPGVDREIFVLRRHDVAP